MVLLLILLEDLKNFTYSVRRQCRNQVGQVNDDSTLDVVFGFGTGADGYNIPDFVCDIYFAGQQPCLGGVLALDGRDGRELWRLWTPHEVGHRGATSCTALM